MHRILAPDVHAVANVRDLGGYDTPDGPTRAHRFVRCGSTASTTIADLRAFKRWGVRHVIDLRSFAESPRQTCRFARKSWVSWHNVALYDVDISAPTMMPAHDTGNYLVQSYLHMLASDEAIRQIFSICAHVPAGDCLLFHCAAGMDRTGMMAMLLLGLAGVPREQIIADYCYSFAPQATVDGVVGAYCRTGELPKKGSHREFLQYLLRSRMEAIAVVYDTVVAEHGTTRAFIASCGVPDAELDAVRAHLLD